MAAEPKGKILRAVSADQGYSLRPIDFFNVAIEKDGKQIHVFQSPRGKRDRIYSYTILPDKKQAVFGASFGTYLFDLEQKKVLREFIGHTGLTIALAPSPDGRLFLTGSTDQTIRLWNPAKKEPILSLYFSGRDWIAWTPHGFYAASPYGERLMGWQVNNGIEQMTSYHPAVRFRQSLYAPDAIRLIAKLGSVEQAISVANTKREKKIVPVHVTQVLPPDVEIVDPPNLVQRIDKDKIQVTAVAKKVGNHPVTAMRLLVDGRPYRGNLGLKKFDAEPGPQKATWTVRLYPGRHTIAVQAQSKVSKAVSKPLSITRSCKVEKPNLYIVSVGISAYKGPMALKYAAADAIEIDKVFRSETKGVFDKVEAKLITNKEAKAKSLIAALKWLKSKMTAKDVALLFFAGHGARDRKGNFVLVPVDFNPLVPGNNCVPGKLLKASLANLPGRIILMLDACHSGAVAEDKKRAAPDNLVRDLITEDYGVVTMCSSLGNEFSLESPAIKHGYFTVSVVEGLKGKGDYNKDGYVYLHEVDMYAYHRVRELSRGRQNPTTGRPPHMRSFPVAQPVKH